MKWNEMEWRESRMAENRETIPFGARFSDRSQVKQKYRSQRRVRAADTFAIESAADLLCYGATLMLPKHPPNEVELTVGKNLRFNSTFRALVVLAFLAMIALIWFVLLA